MREVVRVQVASVNARNEGENEVMMTRVYMCGLKFPHTEISLTPRYRINFEAALNGAFPVHYHEAQVSPLVCSASSHALMTRTSRLKACAGSRKNPKCRVQGMIMALHPAISTGSLTTKTPTTASASRLGSVQDLEELLASGGRGGLLDGALGLSLLSEELLSAEGLGVGVESEEDGLVSEGVLLLGEGSCGISENDHEQR